MNKVWDKFEETDENLLNYYDLKVSDMGENAMKR